MATIDFENQIFQENENNTPIIFEELVQVAPGVQCGVFSFDKEGERDKIRDLGIIIIEPGGQTPIQRVILGDRTIEGLIYGSGALRVIRSNGGNPQYETHYFDSEDLLNPTTNISITVSEGDIMQWTADPNTYLIVYEICEPPFTEGRFETIE